MLSILTQMIVKKANGAIQRIVPGKNTPTVQASTKLTANPTRMATQIGVLGSGGDTIGFTMTNATGATATYVIGDAYGNVAGQLNKTVLNPTSQTAFTVAGFKARCATRPLGVLSMNLQTSSDATEFAQQFQYGYLMGNDGSAAFKPLVLGVFASPSDYNDLIRPVSFSGFSQQVVLGPDSGLFLPVLDGETLTAYVTYNEQVL